MLKKVEGIVVSSVDYKESSKIINVFTKDCGIVGVLATGSKRLKSNISATSNVLVYGYFYLKSRNNGMFVLEEVDVIDSFKMIKRDLIRLNYSIYLLELATQVYRHDNNNIIYELLIAGLKKINEGLEPEIISIILELKLLEYLGIKPIIDRCVGCGSTRDLVTISSYKGGYLCKKCVEREKVFNIKTLKLIRMFYYVDLNKITRIDVSSNIIRELSLFVDDYYDRYSGLYLKSKVFLREFANKK